MDWSGYKKVATRASAVRSGAKIHLCLGGVASQAWTPIGSALCGAGEDRIVSTYPKLVTCRRCLRIIAKRGERT